MHVAQVFAGHPLVLLTRNVNSILSKCRRNESTEQARDGRSRGHSTHAALDPFDCIRHSLRLSHVGLTSPTDWSVSNVS